MTLFWRIITIFWVLMVFSNSEIHAQDFSVIDFCSIQGTSAAQRIDKIIRWFKLPYRTAGQLRGKSKCPKGEFFKIKTSCVGLHRVAIISLSKKRYEKPSLKTTRLFHLFRKRRGGDKLTLCQPLSN